MTCIRSLNSAHASDVLSLSAGIDGWFSCAASGDVQRWTNNFTRDGPAWRAHDGIILTSILKPHDSEAINLRNTLFTGGSDHTLKIWDVTRPMAAIERPQQGLQGRLFHLLSEFVSYKTVSSPEHREDCRQGAIWLRRALSRLGADAQILPGAPNANPLVLATFRASRIEGGSPVRRKRCLFYGHYDVVKPGRSEDWTSSPWVLTGRNEWVYGRGVTDDKGPLLAVACAAAELLEAGKLDIDLVMLIEGEEETGSAGFQQAVLDAKEAIGNIDVVLLSNSYWIGQTQPCMTYGLRGVVHANVQVTSARQDLHSGQHGGSVDEPLAELVRLLSALVDSTGRVTVPGFYESVRPIDDTEGKLYDELFAGLNECVALAPSGHLTHVGR